MRNRFDMKSKRSLSGEKKYYLADLRALETIRDNYNKYVFTTDFLLQKRNGIHHVNLMDFMLSENRF